MKSPWKLLLLAVLAAISATPARCQVVMTDRAAARFLDQATWGPSSASIAKLQQMGIRNWLDWQFSLNSSDLPDQPINILFNLGLIHGLGKKNADAGPQ